MRVAIVALVLASGLLLGASHDRGRPAVSQGEGSREPAVVHGSRIKQAVQKAPEATRAERSRVRLMRGAEVRARAAKEKAQP